MTDDITVAFDSLEARAIASAPHDPLDRICVRDFIKTVEIGAFQSERDTVQRIRFNVVLEVAKNMAAASDDVDQVLSYDTITQAIEAQLAFERLNLLETLAERIADSILVHPRAARVFIRIEKLDRIPGSLGIDIVRSKSADVQQEPGTQVQPLVVLMPNRVLHGAKLTEWVDAIAAHDLPAIICLEPVQGVNLKTDSPEADHHIGLLAIEQNAWILAAKDARCVVASSRTELDWAVQNGQMSVWAPAKLVLDAVDKPDAGPDTPLALTQWFAKQFMADHVVVLEDFDVAEISDRLMLAATPDAL
jgi:7,8-dihydroneopterin aldolase/epimerase/oxygenase